MNKYSVIEWNGEKYPVTYRYDKIYAYAKAIVKGVVFEGHGTDDETAYWNLENQIHICFEFKA